MSKPDSARIEKFIKDYDAVAQPFHVDPKKVRERDAEKRRLVEELIEDAKNTVPRPSPPGPLILTLIDILSQATPKAREEARKWLREHPDPE